MMHVHNACIRLHHRHISRESAVDITTAFPPRMSSPSHELMCSHRPIPGVICPKCGREGTTTVEGYPGACSYLAMVGCCMVGCICGCCLIPLHLDSCQDLSHKCNKPTCHHEIGVYSRLFGSSIHDPPPLGLDNHKEETMESPIT